MRSNTLPCLPHWGRWRRKATERGFFAKCDYIETAKDKLPQKVWKECVYCPQYPYCNEIAFVKTTVDYEPSHVKF